MPILRVFAKVVPELTIPKGFIVMFGEGVGKAQESESASESDPLSTDNDGCWVVTEIVRVLQYKGVEPGTANAEIHDNRVIIRGMWSTVRIIPRHYVSVNSTGIAFGMVRKGARNLGCKVQ